MNFDFNGSPEPTVGVEIELGLVDQKTGALSNSIHSLLEKVPEPLHAFVKPEFKQSYCEIITDVCNDVVGIEADLEGKLEQVEHAADQCGLGLLWSATHPFSLWSDQKLTKEARYEWLMDTMQFVAERLTVFGMHIHVGVDSGDKAIQMCDRLLRHLPTMLALSSNSPHWCARDTGLQSYRSKVMESLPTAGMPFPLRNWSEYVWMIKNLISTGFIHSIREIWWDVRPHAKFGTVEIRVMDQPMCMRHLLGLTALTQSLVAGISEDIDRGAYQFDSHPMIAKQNKWHAARYGMDASFVDFDTMLAIPARQMARRLIDQVTPFAERLGCLTQLGYLEEIIDDGSGAEQQRRAYRQNGEMTDVVDYLLAQRAKETNARVSKI